MLYLQAVLPCFQIHKKWQHRKTLGDKNGRICVGRDLTEIRFFVILNILQSPSNFFPFFFTKINIKLYIKILL